MMLQFSRQDLLAFDEERGAKPKPENGTHPTMHAKGDNIMSGSGKRDKGNKEQKKKAKHDIKEKRKLKKEKKQKSPFMPA